MSTQPEVLHIDPADDWNGDYSWCDGCKAWVHIDFWETNFDHQGLPFFTHRGHNMDRETQ
jgi:hypothetical protein